MAELSVNICPETGICSIGRGGTDKIDLMPDEVETLREAEDTAGVKAVIADCDAGFAETLSEDELVYIAHRVR